MPLLLLGGWLASANAADATRQEQPPLDTPAWVLDGTDLVELNQLQTTELPALLEGSWQAEQGGALLSLTIAADSGDRWMVTRVYEEPELEVQTRDYVVERRGAALVSIDGDLVIQGGAEGLLVLESNSGSDAIPADYWVHYLPLQ